MKPLFQLLLSFGILASVSARPSVIDDQRIMNDFQKKAAQLAETEEYPSLDALREQLAKPFGMPELAEVEAPSEILNSVFVVGTVYDCGKCDQWHLGGLATAWVLASDGVFCTNYHVVDTFKGGLMAVSSWDGKVYPVTEILMADKANDVAVFRVEAEGLVPLPLAAEEAKVGAKVSCLSHPKQHFFLRTFGEVSRYQIKRTRNRRGRVPQMAITADYAQGSSGGPILNDKNEVVGMVSATSSLYSKAKEGAEQQQGHLQMVMKNCVPAFVIEELLTKSQESKESSVEAASEEVAPADKEPA